MASLNRKLTSVVAAAIVVLSAAAAPVLHVTMAAAAPPPPATRAAAGATAPSTTAAGALGEIDREMEALLARKLPELRVEAVAAGDVIDFLRDVTGANIYVEARALKAVGGEANVPITLEAREVSLADVLRQVAPKMSGGRGTFIAIDGVIIITAADDLPRLRAAREWHANMPVDAATKKILDRPLPEARFEKIPFRDTIDFLRDVSGANIFVDWRAIEVAGVLPTQPVTLRLREVPLRTVLWLLLESAQAKPDGPLDFRVDEQGVINISTSADIARAGKRGPAAATATAPAIKPAPAAPAAPTRR